MKRKQKVTIVLWSVLALYAVSYVVLSLAGNYSGYLSISGKVRYESGLAVPDVREWEPYGVFKSNRGYNFLGLIYAPLVDLDQRFWHKAVDVFSDEGPAQVVPGTVVGWGENSLGEATGTPSRELAAGVVLLEGRPLDEAISVSAGQSYGLAVRSNGTVVGWGGNFRGRAIGDDKEFPRNASGLVRIGGNLLTNVVAVSAGVHSSGLLRDGTVVAWGRDSFGPVGTPIESPSGLSDVVAIAACENYHIAVRKDGTVAYWEGRGMLGATLPPQGLSGVTAVALAQSFHGHGLALLKDRTVLAWGLRHNSSSRVEGATNVIAIAAGFAHYLALIADGTVVEWGFYDPVGLSGNGISGAPAADLICHPVVIDGKPLENVKAIAAGQGHSLALKWDGTVVAWEEGGKEVPVPAGLKGVVAISAGNGFSLAITTNHPPLPPPKVAR